MNSKTDTRLDSVQQDTIRAMVSALDASLPPMPKGYEDWRYLDFPPGVVLSHKDLGEFLSRLGEGNYKILAMSGRSCANGETGYRGQFWISPAGIANLLKATKDPSQ